MEKETTYTLYVWPYFCLREDSKAIKSGLTKEQCESIIKQKQESAPGVMFYEPDEV